MGSVAFHSKEDNKRGEEFRNEMINASRLFWRNYTKAGVPELVNASTGMEEQRLFIRRALEHDPRNLNIGFEPEKAQTIASHYSAKQVRRLMPFAKELVYERAAENGWEIAGLKKGDRVAIIYDNSRARMADAFHDAAVLITGSPGNVITLNIDDEERYGQRPFTSRNTRLHADIGRFRPTHTFFAAEGKEGEVSFRIPLIKFCTHTRKCAHAHSPGLTPWMMADGMFAPHEEMVRITQAVQRVVKDAAKVRVTTKAGTDMVYDVGKFGWVASHSIGRGAMGNLPMAEIFTCPASANGTMVVDGVLGDDFIGYGPLKETPVRLSVMEGRVVYVECVNGELKARLIEYMKRDENANRIGELGIGTNTHLVGHNGTGFVGNMLQDEKNGIRIQIKERVGRSYKVLVSR